MRRDTAELLAAYADGGAELTLEERRRVEHLLASSDEAKADEAATRELIGTLRELPEATRQAGPDWASLERAIQASVPDRTPAPWWRTWRLAIPVLALGGATLLAVMLTRPPAEDPVAIDHPVAPPPVAEQPVADDTVAVYLDGDDIELSEETAAIADTDLDDMTYDEMDPVGDLDDGSGLLSSDDLEWIDDLDATQLDRVEGWLDQPLHNKDQGS